MYFAIILYSLALVFSLLSFVMKKGNYLFAIAGILTLLASALYCYFMQYDLIYSLLGFAAIGVVLLFSICMRGGKREL